MIISGGYKSFVYAQFCPENKIIFSVLKKEKADNNNQNNVTLEDMVSLRLCGIIVLF